MKKKCIAMAGALWLALSGAGGIGSVSAETRALYRAENNLALPPAVVQEIQTEEEYASLVASVTENSLRPQIALFYPDAALHATGAAVSDIVSALKGAVLPAFYVENGEVAEAFSEYAQTSDLYDAFVVSDDPSLISSVKEKAKALYGVLDVRNSNDTHAQTVAAVNTCGARCAWVDGFSKKDTEYLQYRSVGVWASGEEDAVLSGANGVVCGSPEKVYAFIESLPENTLLRNPMIVGHRGLETTKLENSLSGLRAAFSAGADAVECDFQVTKDNRLVVMHDETLQRTTNGTGTIKEMNYEEMKDFLIDYPKAAKDKEPIPLLDDFFAEIKQNGKILFVEIKSTDERSVPLLKELVNQYGVADQIIIISFFAKQIERARELLPEIAVSDLNFTPKSSSLQTVVRDAATRGVTISPVWSEVNADVGYELFVRGFNMGCWTYKSAADLGNGYASGWNSLTVSDASWASELIEGTEGALALYSNRAVQPKISAVTLSGAKVEKEVKIVDADFEYTQSQDGITASANGSFTATVCISFTGCGKTFSIYEKVPVTVTSYSEEIIPPDPPVIPENPDDSENQGGNGGESSSGSESPQNNSGLIIGLSVAAGVVLVAGIGFFVFALYKRRKK